MLITCFKIKISKTLEVHWIIFLLLNLVIGHFTLISKITEKWILLNKQFDMLLC